MKLFVGQISKSLCNNLISECKNHTVDPHNGNMDLNPGDLFYEDHLKQKRLAKEAGYTAGNSIEFRHYYPDEHFDSIFIKEFENITDTQCLLSFVSEIRPGKCAPWHWDINPWLNDYPQKDIIRFVCFIDVPKLGQAFMVEDECFYMQAQGSIFKYPRLDSWHAGFNAGLENKFLFTFTGAKLL